MSIESSWDLCSSSSPRSLCVFSPTIPANNTTSGSSSNVAAASSSTNPFDNLLGAKTASSQANNNRSNRDLNTNDGNNNLSVQGVLFGTERGSLHYRCFPSPSRHSRGGLVSSPGRSGGSSRSVATATGGGAVGVAGMGNHNHSSNLLSPLGMSGSSSAGGNTAAIPSSLVPVDLPPGSLPGLVASVIRATPRTKNTTNGRHVFLVLVDDNRGPSASSPGAYLARLVTLHPNATLSFGSSQQKQLPRISCATYHPNCGFVFAKGSSIQTIPPTALWEQQPSDTTTTSTTATTTTNNQSYIAFTNQPILPGSARTGQDAIAVTANGKVVVVAVSNNSFYAISGVETSASNNNTSLEETGTSSAGGVTTATAPSTTATSSNNDNTAIHTSLSTASATATAPTECVKLLSFAQSSQVHSPLVIDLNDTTTTDRNWNVLFLASGRECAVVDLYYNESSSPVAASGASRITCHPPRHEGIVTLASPILAATTSWPWLAVLTSDGLISIRSPSCVAIALRTVEVGTRPNDYFVLRNLVPSLSQQQQQQQGQQGKFLYNNNQSPMDYPNTNNNNAAAANNKTFLISISYSGQGKVLTCLPDTQQDLADRLMRLSIDAFGANGFPRAELAEALQASFTATSYVGGEPTNQSRALLRQYLEATLGLADFESGGICGWPTDVSQFAGTTPQQQQQTSSKQQQSHFGAFYTGSSAGLGGDHSLNTTSNSINNHGNGVITSATPAALLTGTALLCLVCAQLSPLQGKLAIRAAKNCVETMGIVLLDNHNHEDISDAAISVCELVADKLLRDVGTTKSFPTSASGTPRTPTAAGSSSTSYLASTVMEFVEASVWLLRACGKHERAIEVLHERIQKQQQGYSSTTTSSNSSGSSGFWSKIKYDSYIATHLSELWGSGRDEGCNLVLRSDATRRLLESKPSLGLSAFTALHPQNTHQWIHMVARDDPLAHPTFPVRVVKLLKSIHPIIPYDYNEGRQTSKNSKNNNNNNSKTDSTDKEKNPVDNLPLESGRALAVTFLESAMGMNTGRPTEEDEFDTLSPDENWSERICNLHDELAYLLLEGVITERGDSFAMDQFHNPQSDEEKNNPFASPLDTSRSPGAKTTNLYDDDSKDTDIGKLYRVKLRRFLQWPLCKVRSDRFMESLPSSFLQERALIYGRIGKHEDALRILYSKLGSMELALAYCDIRYERQKIAEERYRMRTQNVTQGTLFEDSFYVDENNMITDSHYHPNESKCAYLPLIRVALEDDNEQVGITAAIQVLALRRSAIDRGAALRLLPQDIPVAAVARPFLIPALVDSESQVRRLMVVSSLLRARYVRLKQQLTNAQLQAQAHISIVPQLKSLLLGDNMIHPPTKPQRGRPSSSASPTFPEVVIIKYFYTRHLVIQAKITHSLEGRVLGDATFVVAESSEESIQPLLQVPIKILPYQTQGSSWCVLSVSSGLGNHSQHHHQQAPGGGGLARMGGGGGGGMDPTIILTCELRYTVLEASDTNIGDNAGGARIYVEELQDLEVPASYFTF